MHLDPCGTALPLMIAERDLYDAALAGHLTMTNAGPNMTYCRS